MSSTEQNKVLLIILDGYGIGPKSESNVLFLANTPTLDNLETTAPHTLLKTDSEAVGLPANTMGGSEVGHYTIGAGKVVMQSLPAINKEITDGTFFTNPELLKAINHAKSQNSALHLVGMISDAGVHSHIDHLFALLELAKQHSLNKVFIHAITDGRDVPERSAGKFLEQISQKINQLKIGQVTDLIGRYYAMDRDENWDRTEKAFRLYTANTSQESAESYDQGLKTYYSQSEESDYYLPPIKLTPTNEGQIKSEDSVIFFNYRTDRAKELTDAFTITNFTHFQRELAPLPYIVCFGEYTKIAPVAFKPEKVSSNLGKIISDNNLKQLRIAETEKYPHVTFFFNSQNKAPYPLEESILIPSPKVSSYDQKPEMSANELTQALIPAINKNDYSLIVCNFANMDLVGHSGNIKATVKACEVVDHCLEQILDTAKANNYSVIITGDHGNAEEMSYADGSACPSHSMNPTQCIVLTNKYKSYKLNATNNGLQDIAPTILQLLNIEKPSSMTGESLINLN